MSLLNIIEEVISPSPELIKVMPQNIQLQHFKKGEMVMSVGDVCHRMYFVEKGILRFLYYNEAGKDITQWFATEGKAIFEVESFFKGIKSEFGIQALEDTTAYSITLDSLNYLLENFPELEKFGRITAIEAALEMGQRLKDIQFRTAKERYQTLIEKHPDIHQRVSLGHIASYLGITQQSLSRIRAQKLD